MREKALFFPHSRMESAAPRRGQEARCVKPRGDNDFGSFPGVVLKAGDRECREGGPDEQMRDPG